MNLFENLQMMKESEDKEPIKCLVNDNGDYINVYKRKSTGKIMAQGNIPGASFNGPWTDEHEKYYKDKGFKEETEDIDVSNERLDQEFYEFLKSKNAQYIVDNLNETEFGLEFDIYNGDWKHEHAYIKQLVREFFDNKGIHGAISSEVIDDSESDTYSAHYDVILEDELTESSIDISQYVELSTHIGNWDLYRKITPNKQTKWAAKNQKTGEVKEITYAQAKGDEPIDKSVNGKQIGKKFGLKREASYGGAFDIKDDQYFTREDLNEFAYEVINKVADLTNGDIYLDLISIYFEEDKSLEMTVEIDDEEYSYCKVIDMSKIKIPSDLNIKYADEYANGLINEINSNNSEYLDYQGHDTRTGEDKDANYDFWK